VYADETLISGLDGALDFYRSLGRQVEVETTSPPRKELTGRYRVLRIRELTSGSIVLTAAREDDGKEV